MKKPEIKAEKIVDRRIDKINDEIDYLNEEFTIIRNGVSHIIKMINEEKELSDLSI